MLLDEDVKLRHESNNFWITSNWSKQWPESFQIFLERSAVNTMGWTTWTNTKSSKQALKPKILWNFSRLSYLKRLPWWDKSTLGFNFTVRTFSPVATPCNIAKSNRFWIYLASIQQQPVAAGYVCAFVFRIGSNGGINHPNLCRIVHSRQTRICIYENL